MSAALMAKLGGFFTVSEHLSQLLNTLCDDVVTFAPGEVLVGQDGDYSAIYLIENGWAVRSKALEDGGRQIVNVILPGDFVALNALLFRTSDFEHLCKTEVSAFRIAPETMRRMLATDSSLAPALFWINAHEESMLAERIVSLGRRSARTRAAHVLCEIISRLEIIQEVSFPEIAIPLSQTDFADILGISLVHMNKVLRALEREEIIAFRMGLLMVHDMGALRRLAGFEDGYLHFTQREDGLA